MRQRADCRPLSPVFDWAIGVTAALYAICTVLLIPAMAQVDWTALKPREIWTGPIMFLMALELAYTVIWLVLAGLWLAWFAMLIDWAQARQVDTPGKLVALGSWFVCGINCALPFVILSKIAKGTSVRTPLAWWWGITWASLVLAMFATANMARGGYDPLLIGASALELVALFLCWRIPRDFRAADREWDPRAALEQRG